MKQVYEKPEVEIVTFTEEDVVLDIFTSTVTGPDFGDGGHFCR